MGQLAWRQLHSFIGNWSVLKSGSFNSTPTSQMSPLAPDVICVVHVSTHVRNMCIRYSTTRSRKKANPSSVIRFRSYFHSPSPNKYRIQCLSFAVSIMKNPVPTLRSRPALALLGGLITFELPHPPHHHSGFVHPLTTYRRCSAFLLELANLRLVLLLLLLAFTFCPFHGCGACPV